MIKFNCSMSITSDFLNSSNNSVKESTLSVLLNSLNDLPESFFKDYYDYLKLLSEKWDAYKDKGEYDYLKSECNNLYINLNEKYGFNPYFNLLDYGIVERYDCEGIYCQSIPLNELFNVINGCYDGWFSLEDGVYYFNVCHDDELLKHDITKSYINNEILSLEISFYNEERLLSEIKSICENKFGKYIIPY